MWYKQRILFFEHKRLENSKNMFAVLKLTLIWTGWTNMFFPLIMYITIKSVWKFKKKKPALGKIEVAVSERFCPSKGNPQPRTEGTNSYSLCLKMGSILCCNLGRLDFTWDKVKTFNFTCIWRPYIGLHCVIPLSSCKSFLLTENPW